MKSTGAPSSNQLQLGLHSEAEWCIYMLVNVSTTDSDNGVLSVRHQAII